MVPITDYVAGVMGFKAYDEHDKLQNRAICKSLGLGKSTCLLAKEAEIGWLRPRYRRYCEIVQLWHRLVNMDTYRRTYKVFMPPTSEEVEGAYWFGSVGAVQCSQSVSL